MIHVVHQNMPYRGQTGLQQLQLTLNALPNVKLVIVDPVGKLIRLADSDSYDEVTLAVELLEQIAKKYSLHLMFATHGKKRASDDVGDSPIGSTGFRGGTDTNIFLGKQGGQRLITTEQRWGVAMEPTLLKFNEERHEMYLGMSVAAEEEQRQEHKDRKTMARIESDILDLLSSEGNPAQGEVLKAVTGKDATKLEVLDRLVSSGRIKPEQEGKAIRYSVVELPTEERMAA